MWNFNNTFQQIRDYGRTMSAPTPAPGDSSPTSGYYPDPSIPGYIRYWNGAAWVPGTSRPAPAEGEPMPVPPGGAEPAPGVLPEQQVAPADETGPMFLDEEPAATRHQPTPDRPEHPEPSSAWQADASRQTGFVGEPNRVSWGGHGETDPHGAQDGAPQQPGDEQSGSPAPGGRTDGTVTIRALKPGRAPQGQDGGAQQGGPQTPAQGTGAPQGEGGQGLPPADGTMMVRRVRPGGNEPGTPGGAPQQPEPGTMAIRALPGQQYPPGLQQGAPDAANSAPAPSGYGYPQSEAPQQGAPGQPAQGSGYGYPQSGAPQQGAPGQPAPGSGYGYPQPQSGGQPGSPVTAGSGGGAASWPQQVQQLAQGPEAEAGPVTPFKPPVSDPFLAVAQAQAAARPAGLGKRLAARLIDTVVLAAVTGAAAVPLLGKSIEHIDGKIQAAKMSGVETTVWFLDGTTSLHLGIVLAVLLVFGVLYEALPTSKWGFTLGKKLLKVEVRDIEGHAPPTFSAALRRWLVYCVPGLLVLGVLGVLWCTWDRPWRQCWHDKAARTFVAG